MVAGNYKIYLTNIIFYCNYNYLSPVKFLVIFCDFHNDHDDNFSQFLSLSLSISFFCIGARHLLELRFYLHAKRKQPSSDLLKSLHPLRMKRRLYPHPPLKIITIPQPAEQVQRERQQQLHSPPRQ